ncbi:hypothetical protein [Neorhizobium galegae]|uniref:hypothetical protein n=1 Tax=Neorhizobium galegae TaxID=399 RepID=UPI000A7BE0FA
MAKSTFDNHFPSKDDLVVAYFEKMTGSAGGSGRASDATIMGRITEPLIPTLIHG